MWNPPFLRSSSTLPLNNGPNSPTPSSTAIPTAANPNHSTPNQPMPPPRPPSAQSNDDEERIFNRVRLLTVDSIRRHPSINMSMNYPDFSSSASPSPNGSIRNNNNNNNNHSRRSRATSYSDSNDHRLSVIDENQDHVPALPANAAAAAGAHHNRTYNRPLSRRFGLGHPPKYDDRDGPPQYAAWEAVGGRGEKWEELRNNRFIARRGGWLRLCIIFWLLLLIIIALAVGLGVGLGTKSHSSNSMPAASNSSNATAPFPAGSYTFTTFLSVIATNCTSNTTTWSCQPSVTFDQNQASSEAQFNWIIAAASNHTPTNFTISSTNNPFSIDFHNVTLQHLDVGQDTERFNFQTTVQKIVLPANTFNIKCFYNNTQFSANLFTKRPKTAPSPNNSTVFSYLENGSLVNSSSQAGTPTQQPMFGEWPFAVDATQSTAGGIDVPDCYEYSSGAPKQLTQGLNAQPGNEFCSCAYTNYNP